MTGLDTFFATMGAFLLERRGVVHDVERALGPSASGSARLALYRTLVTAQHVQVLEQMFPALRRALGPEPFDALVHEFLVDGRCESGSPVALAAPFAAFVVASAASRALPAWAPELADFHAVDIELVVAPDAAMSAARTHPHVRVRLYTHDVVRYTREQREGAPDARATPVILYREEASGRVRSLEGTPERFVALAVADGTMPRARAVAAIGEIALARGAAALAARGIVRGVAA